MIFLQSHGVSSGYATKIFKQYGNELISVVRENPYRLATDIFGIGFITADKIAEKLGFAKDSELRAQAGILYVLLQRNLIYTGITRGRKLVVLVGTKKALAIAVKNNKTQKRYTWLKTKYIAS
jgi:ATP-dependent exoDNAse (exonuclease V) alpha subunit